MCCDRLSPRSRVWADPKKQEECEQRSFGVDVGSKADIHEIIRDLGARGLGVKYVFDNGPDVEAFSPDNLDYLDG